MDKLKMRMPSFTMDTFHRSLKDSLKNPAIGVTQGGSSRKHSGARVAATTAEVKQPSGELNDRHE
jgi:hypothetical protein